MRKVYVDVVAKFKDGNILPLDFTWEDGRRYKIDRVLDIKPAASMKAGGYGLRYSVMILGSQKYIWFEDGIKWFMEGK